MAEEAGRLVCAACGLSLTRLCRWSAEDAYDGGASDGAPAVPEGVLIRLAAEISTPIYRQGGEVGIHVYSPPGAIAAHPDDLVRANLSPCGADNGCCGSDGQDGPNRACVCGAVVATEWSDCWTPAEVRFLPGAVKVYHRPLDANRMRT